jgi:hypothetical protein
MRLRITGVVIVVVLAIGASAARAQAPEGSSSDDAKAVQAGGHLKQGKAFFDNKVYDQAIKEFEASYAIVPNPAIQYSIAEAYELGGDLKNALATYQKYLSLVGETELTDTARAKVASLTKQISDSDAARQKWDAEREQRRHGRKVGDIFIFGVGGVGAATLLTGGLISTGGGNNSGGNIAAVGGVLLFVGLIYGIPKRLVNSDPGEFHISVSASGGTKSLMLSRSF